MKRSLAAVGDVSDVATWSGIPSHFWRASRSAGFATGAWQVDLAKLKWQRRIWNAGRLLLGQTGGFQYSPWFLDTLEGQVPPEQWTEEVLTFNQHFPRSKTVRQMGGNLSHYLDAPFAALASGRGLDLRLPKQIVRRARAQERENLAGSQRVISMARWADEVIQGECGIPKNKTQVILPGANLELPAGWSFPEHECRAGKDRPFTLGFLGKDWLRKGLYTVVAVRDELVRRGWKVRVLAAGVQKRELERNLEVEITGFIDKRSHPEEFLCFLTACDVGCLFSDHEALGISTLEFLRAGVPVAGFAHEGMADTLPPDAGFRFSTGTTVAEIADRFEAFLQDEALQAVFRANAQRWAKLVTWERCVREFQELWQTGAVAHPVQPWRGLASQETLFR